MLYLVVIVEENVIHGMNQRDELGEKYAVGRLFLIFRLFKSILLFVN